MYGFIRTILSLIIFISACFCIKKTKITKKKRAYIIALFVSIIICTISNFVPVENNFITFSTPAKAYKYLDFITDIKIVIEGNESALVIGESIGSNRFFIIPKADDGWKLGLGMDTQKVDTGVVKDVFYRVYQHKNTEDYFVIITNAVAESVAISDSADSEFLSFESGNGTLSYCAFIPSMDKQYRLIVDGYEIQIINE